LSQTARPTPEVSVSAATPPLSSGFAIAISSFSVDHEGVNRAGFVEKGDEVAHGPHGAD
jgi:hypothetical protein